MRRRQFLYVLAGAAVALSSIAAAEQTRPRHLVGILAHDLQPGLLETFRDEIHKLGYVEGKTIGIELRNASGRNDRLPSLVDELLRLKVDVIVAVNTPAAKAAQKATKTAPIVILRVADPVRTGLVTSLAHPDGNVTGLSFMPGQLGAKGVEIMREVLPRITRLGAFYRGDNPGSLEVVDEVEAASKQLGLELLRLPVVEPKDYAGAFETATRAGIEALFVMDDGSITKQRQLVLDLSAKHRLPVVGVYKDFAKAGALIAYGPSLNVVYRRSAQYVDRLLKGEVPKNLPVEQPTKFDLFVNLKTAKALGITIPPSVMLRADEIIE
jgi:putative ABC transport system substrate-binding protein